MGGLGLHWVSSGVLCGFLGSPILGRAGEERANACKKSQIKEPGSKEEAGRGSDTRPGVADQRLRVVSRTTLRDLPGPCGKMTLMSSHSNHLSGLLSSFGPRKAQPRNL